MLLHKKLGNDVGNAGEGVYVFGAKKYHKVTKGDGIVNLKVRSTVNMGFI